MKLPNSVILKLEGGLGNQLFEFAAGYYLSGKLKTSLHLDQYSIPLTTVHGETKCGFESFEIPALPDNKEIVFLKALPKKLTVLLARRSLLVKRILIKLRMLTSNRSGLKLFLETNEETSMDQFYAIKEPVKLHGNFQSWDIVEQAAQFGFPRILRLQKMPKWISELEKEIDFKNSIVLHFRVGDDSKTNLNFKQPDIAYYLEALKILKSTLKVNRTYILSDDIQRVKDMFSKELGSDVHFLEMPNDSSPAERMYVLSLFGGIACANSTFCGWAAWSISNSGGKVIVPVPYSDGSVLGSRNFPREWIKLDKRSGIVVK